MRAAAVADAVNGMLEMYVVRQWVIAIMMLLGRMTGLMQGYQCDELPHGTRGVYVQPLVIMIGWEWCFWSFRFEDREGWRMAAGWKLYRIIFIVEFQKKSVDTR